MRRRTPAGQEVGIDLLLAGSDAFRYLADELAADYARRYNAGDRPDTLEWAKRLAEFAGWWCGASKRRLTMWPASAPKRIQAQASPSRRLFL
jgi:hypothetical protein